MIWNSSHLQAHILQGPERLATHVSDCSALAWPDPAQQYIAIVGGGPKGFYALERLLMLWKANSPAQKICIHWFNTNAYFACGQNYRTDLPNYLLINYSIGNINCWTEGPQPHIAQAMPLESWIKHHILNTAEVNSIDFASRELVGYYYIDALLRLLQIRIPNVEIQLIAEEVLDISMMDSFTLYSKDKALPYSYSSVLMSTGHCYKNKHQELEELAAQHTSFTYIHNAYPIQQLDAIAAGTEVAIMGIGLTFVDVALQLTEGRGGVFYYTEEGELAYRPSGTEPILFPFSRTNLPMIPRKGFVQSDSHYKPYLMTEAWVEDLLKRPGQLNFNRDILPTVEQEVRCAFYAWELQEDNLDAKDLLAHIATLKDANFSIYSLFQPFKDMEESQMAYFQEHSIDLMNYVFSKFKKSDAKDGFLHSLQAVRHCWTQLRKLYNFNKLDPDSHAEFDSFWSSNFSRICFGPPFFNMEKIFCLVKARIIQFRFAEAPTFSYNDASLQLTSAHFQKSFSTFIDARIPRGNLKQQNNKLYANLLHRGIISELCNGDYHTGALAINAAGKSVNQPEALLYFYGTPTEGSVLDNDSLSRNTYNYGIYWAQETADKYTFKNQ